MKDGKVSWYRCPETLKETDTSPSRHPEQLGQALPIISRGSGKMAQLLKCMLYNGKDSGGDIQHPNKCNASQAWWPTCNPRIYDAETVILEQAGYIG